MDITAPLLRSCSIRVILQGMRENARKTPISRPCVKPSEDLVPFGAFSGKCKGYAIKA